MAGEIQVNSVTALTESGSNIVLNNVDTATNRTNLGLGSMATQAANSVSISGGNITGGTIGSSVVFPANHVIQVVYAQSTTATSITSTTQGSGTSTGLSATITPVSSSNKFFISYVGSFQLANHANPAMSIEIYDGSSVVATENGTWGIYINGDGNEYDNTWKYPFQTYITPSGSGPITYTVRAWKNGNAVTAQHNSRLSTLTIMEIQQ